MPETEKKHFVEKFSHVFESWSECVCLSRADQEGDGCFSVPASLDCRVWLTHLSRLVMEGK